MSRRMGSDEAARVLRSSSRTQAVEEGPAVVGALLGKPAVAPRPRPTVAALSASRTATRRRAMYWRTSGIWILGISSIDLRTLRGTSRSKPEQYASGGNRTQ